MRRSPARPPFPPRPAPAGRVAADALAAVAAIVAPAALAALLAVAAVAAVAAPASRAAEEALTEEDVVRLWVAGTAPAELVRRIESAGAAYALEPEMLDELRRAGLPEDVVQAMIRRQAAADASARAASGEPDPAVAEPGPEEAGDAVRVRVNPDAEEPRVWTVPRRLPPQLLEQLGVRDPEARVEDAALFVACLDAPYVPDQWRIKSPLGRDFSMPRHRLLAFRPGAAPSGNPEDHDAPLELALAGALEFVLAEEPPWRLLVGVALRIGERYYRVAADEIKGFVPAFVAGGPAPTLDVAIEPRRELGGGPPTVRIESAPAS